MSVVQMPKVHRCRAAGCHEMVEWPAIYCDKHKALAGKTEYRDRSHYNRVTRNRTATKHEQYQFYRSKQWRGLRQRALARDHHLCQYCLVRGVVTPANTVDHVVPIEIDAGLATIAGNLATICKDCHRRKTAWEQSYYGTGKANSHTGLPDIHDVKRVVQLIQQSEMAQPRG
jgi:5-methylcytosine-specific restriction endonuclease McrA